MKADTRRHLAILAALSLYVVLYGFAQQRLRGAAPPPPPGYVNLPFDVLRSWTYVEGKTLVPDQIKAFEGKSVQVTGFMLPLTQTQNITEFVLAPYLFGCCFGAPLTPNHIVLVNMAGGTSTPFLRKLISVRGTFHCGEIRRDGSLLSLYVVEANEVVAHH